jgi:hypothetical protein
VIAAAQVGAPSADPGFALGVFFAVAAGFFAVAIHYYFRLTGVGERLLVRRLRRRLRRSSKFLTVPRVGRLLWGVDVIIAVTWRAAASVYLGIVWFGLVPLAMTIGSIALAAAIVPF